MSLKLMYITNDTDIALMAEANGVDRIFVDMEYIGKSDRQGGMNTVQNQHTVDDVKRLRNVLTASQLMVRCNPIHEKTEAYCSSEEEIDSIIDAGADIIMLPYFKTVGEVKSFLNFVKGRVKTLLLFETPESVEVIDDILALDGIDEVFIGLNDLSLGYGKKFMFELLADGTVESLCLKFRLKGLPYGFGGIASLGKGLLPAERVIAEHYRLGSTCAILSRSFCVDFLNKARTEFFKNFSFELKRVRDYETFCLSQNNTFFAHNTEQVGFAISEIVRSMR